MSCCSAPDVAEVAPAAAQPRATPQAAPGADGAAEPSTSAAYRPNPYTGEDSDEEVDAPPPPKKMMGGPQEAEGKGMMAVKPYVGAIVPPSKADASKEPPAQGLTLEYAYGYRAFDSKSNVASNTRGEIIYPLAAIVVALNPADNTQRHFLGHTDDIRCLTQNPVDKDFVASGQNATVDARGRSSAPFALVTNSTNFDESYKLQHPEGARAVRTIAFSADGKYVSTVADDNDHTITIFDWRATKMVAVAKGDKNSILQIKWNPVKQGSNYELISVGVKHSFVWTFDGSSLKGKRIVLAGKGAIQTYNSVTFTGKGNAVLGGFDGSLLVVPGGSGTVSARFDANASAGSKNAAKVFSLDSYEGGIVAGLSDKTLVVYNEKFAAVKTFNFSFKVTAVTVRGKDLIVGTQGSQIFLITGGLDGAVKGGPVDGKFPALTEGHREGELWALAVSKDGQRAWTAGEDNTILAWDLNAHKPVGRAIISEKKGTAPKVKKASTTSLFPQNQCARALSLNTTGTQLVAGTNDGSITVFDAASLKQVAFVDLNSHGARQVIDQEGNWIQTIEFSPDGQWVAVGTHGSVIVILDASNYKVKDVIKSHHSFITHMDWSEDSTLLRSNDGAYEALYHSIAGGKATHVTNASSVKDVQWATQHCPFSWGALGLVHESGGAYVNSTDRSPDQNLLVSADDGGRVALYRNPVPVKGHANYSYRGHSSHVTSCRFTGDGQRVITTGGHDLSLLQWKVGAYDASGAGGKTHTVEA